MKYEHWKTYVKFHGIHNAPDRFYVLAMDRRNGKHKNILSLIISGHIAAVGFFYLVILCLDPIVFSCLRFFDCCDRYVKAVCIGYSVTSKYRFMLVYLCHVGFFFIASHGLYSVRLISCFFSESVHFFFPSVDQVFSSDKTCDKVN